MIQIYIEGREIEIPSDISFEYTLENRLFSNADGYSFDIEIPLRDSRVNTEIFGAIWDKQADVESVRLRADIITPTVSLHGVIMIVGVDDKSLSIQFLEGKSSQNSDELLDETYINRINIGEPKKMPTWLHYLGSIDDGLNCVALPWVLADSGEYVHNELVWDDHKNSYSYKLNDIEMMPFLIEVAKGICKAVGMSFDFSQWEQSEFRHIIVCNTLPSSIHLNKKDFHWAMPHWTVNEFFNKLEYLLGGEFDFDTRANKVSFRFTSDVIADFKPVVVDDVVDEYSLEIDTDSEEKQDKDILKNVTYTDNGYRFWKVDSCDWYVRRYADSITLVRYKTMFDFIREVKKYKYTSLKPAFMPHNVYYVEQVDSYFVLRVRDVVCYPNDPIPAEDIEEYKLTANIWYKCHEVLPVNNFGDFVQIDSDDAESIELDIVPVAIDMAETCTIFLPFNATDTDNPGEEIEIDNISVSQTPTFNDIMSGDDSNAEYYDKLYVGIWKGIKNHDAYTRRDVGVFPDTSNVKVYQDFTYRINNGLNLRLNHGYSRGFEAAKTIDTKKLYKFSFLSDELPSPRATFYIKGKRYICSKLTAEFTERGMSRLIEGEFYRY